MTIVYDAGVLVAAARNDRATWAAHRIRLERGILPTCTAPVVAQVSRSPEQAPLRQFLRGCDVVPFGADQAHAVGALLAEAGTSDVVDAHVVLAAARTRSIVLTAGPHDLEHLASCLPVPPIVRRASRSLVDGLCQERWRRTPVAPDASVSDAVL